MSDIIIASPIGLKLVVETSQNNSLNFDFLSSLEIIMLHQTDVLYMQVINFYIILYYIIMYYFYEYCYLFYRIGNMFNLF